MAKTLLYPGMPADNNQETQVSGMGTSSPAKSEYKSKPIMGFLYSVSKTAYGEFWPLYAGPNTIGRSKENSICLPEVTVSDFHANIVIRKMQNKGVANGVTVFIRDSGSINGTMLNGMTLDLNPIKCQHGDIITVGNNYELYVILVDPDSLGLSQKPDFKSVENNPNPTVGMFAGGMPKGTIPSAMNEQFGNDYQAPASNPFDTRKATIYMQPKK